MTLAPGRGATSRPDTSGFLRYVPNRAARSLVTRRTDSVALVVSEQEQRDVPGPFVGRRFLSREGVGCCGPAQLPAAGLRMAHLRFFYHFRGWLGEFFCLLLAHQPRKHHVQPRH